MNQLRRWSGLAPFEWGFLAGLFALFSAMAVYFPYSGTDWGLMRPIKGIRQMISLAGSPDGRYLGNLAAYGIARLGPLGGLVIAAVIVLTLWLILDISRNRTPVGYLMATALFVAMPLPIWRQAVVWRSGFSRQALAGLCLLVFLDFVRRDLTADEPRKRGALSYLAIVAVGLASAFFAEQVTIYLVVAAATFVGFYRMRFGRWNWAGVAWLLAVAGGAVLMFSDRAYARMFSRYDSYAAVLKTAFTRLNQFYESTVPQNTVLLVTFVVLLALLLALATARRTQGSRSGVEVPASLVMIGGLALVWTGQTVPIYRETEGLVLALAALVPGALLLDDPEDRWTVWVAGASVVLLLIPLLVIYTMGPRGFYPGYLMMLLILSVLLRNVLTLAGRNAAIPKGARLGTWMGIVFAAVIVVAFVANMRAYSAIDAAETRRVAAIRSQMASGSTSVTVEPLPYEQWVEMPDPFAPTTERWYKIYYGLPDDLRINRADSADSADPAGG